MVDGRGFAPVAHPVAVVAAMPNSLATPVIDFPFCEHSLE
jgi:hypothetical protein